MIKRTVTRFVVSKPKRPPAVPAPPKGEAPCRFCHGVRAIARKARQLLLR